jgi:iron complex transport system permease protein
MRVSPSQKTGKTPFYLGVSLVLAALSILTAVSIGTVHIPVQDGYQVILYEFFCFDSFGESAGGAGTRYVWLIRLPRIMLTAAVGGRLSVCGIVMQGIVKNPLADPSIIGIFSGASPGVTLAILLGIGASLGSGYVGIVGQ